MLSIGFRVVCMHTHRSYTSGSTLQALSDRRLVAAEAAAEREALHEWLARLPCAAAALAAPGLPPGMRAEVAALFPDRTAGTAEMAEGPATP